MSKKASARRSTPRPSSAEPHRLLIGTRKGGFILEAGRGRSGWKLQGPFVLGTQVHDLRLDPRDGKTLLMTGGLGHLGPTMYRSTNLGRKWTEVASTPRFDPLPEGSKRQKREDGTSRGMTVKMNFWLEPGHASEPGVWYCGTGPQGLFRSEDRGDNWAGVDGFNLNPNYAKWSITEDGSPIGSLLHSILIDPRDAAHMYLSMSSGGTFESTDQGASWRPLNRGVQVTFGPEEYPEFGQDPHCVILHPADPDRLYQQNHCGIYRLDRTVGDGEGWVRIGAKMPKKVGDIGFGVVGHPTDRDTVWVLPMDGTQIWPRTSPGGKPALYRTSNAGRSWTRLDKGLPEQGWHTVLRQALTIDSDPKSPTLYFGTTSGEVWIGRDGGEKFECLAQHLPYIHSVRTVPRQ
ncbi:WD40/YVTN/BNR-like repeat-containing protein [Engelhardtia mirabilis]|uniref:Dispase autolysis-inducing protein n=1 Tax=Engelhardtia mirabilis TaxID=2528011 RepID=A0A518BRY7_9BACT|nr:Dispase autolysis-inducing protein precursor [Planctomycetes bacterium Pla133]QDV04063.1 Dispase autolysis-inducing protein precursor [Planctomycetes bacterium Pla86]